MSESEIEYEYEEFLVDEIVPEHIGLEFLVGSGWIVIEDVSREFFYFNGSAGLTRWNRNPTSNFRIRRPKPKKKMVRFWRYKVRDGQWWLTLTASEVFRAPDMYSNNKIEAFEPFGEPFEE